MTPELTADEQAAKDFARYLAPMADPMEIEQTQWPGWIALHAEQLLAQMEKGMSISQDSVDCIDLAIGKLEQAKAVIAGRGFEL